MSVVTTRPNGKVYRPRKSVAVDTFENYEGEGVVVWRTHNFFHAGLLAAHEILSRDLDPAHVSLSWWRKVPWDATGNNEYDWTLIDDPTSGVPVVVWDP